jgi:hypothetical protein
MAFIRRLIRLACLLLHSFWESAVEDYFEKRSSVSGGKSLNTTPLKNMGQADTKYTKGKKCSDVQPRHLAKW